MRTCVVTGVSSGIGFATAARLLRGGDQVVGWARNGERLDAAVAELGQRGPFSAVPCDVADREQVEQATADLGRVDVLVAAAGVCRQARLDDDNSDDVWDEVLGTNLSGTYFCIRALAPRLREGASIVVVSSGLGKNGRAGYEAYCASKHALLGLVKCVALELAPNVRVNAVCPGWVDAPMSRSDLQEAARRSGIFVDALRDKCIKNLALKRLVQPDDVAAQICWLASREARSITGQAYNISCGEFFNG